MLRRLYWYNIIFPLFATLTSASFRLIISFWVFILLFALLCYVLERSSSIRFFFVLWFTLTFAFAWLAFTIISLRINLSIVTPSTYWSLAIRAIITCPIVTITNKGLFVGLWPYIILLSRILEHVTPTWVRLFNILRLPLIVFLLNMNCNLLATCKLSSFEQACSYLRVLSCCCLALDLNCPSVSSAASIGLIGGWCRNCRNHFV